MSWWRREQDKTASAKTKIEMEAEKIDVIQNRTRAGTKSRIWDKRHEHTNLIKGKATLATSHKRDTRDKPDRNPARAEATV